MSDTSDVKVNTEALTEQLTRPYYEPVRQRRSKSDVVIELAYERNQISDRLERLELAIEVNSEGLSDHHKDLWRKQAEAMRTYKRVLGERIKDLIDQD